MLLALAVATFVLAACGGSDTDDRAIADRTIRVAATTNLVADLATQIGGDRVEVSALMGPGVDPHLYKASAGDVNVLRDADIVFYNGLELEGRMTDLFVEIASDRPTVPVARGIDEDDLESPSQFAGKFDPHVWFDVTMWQDAARETAKAYIELDPEHEAAYEARLADYLDELETLDAEVQSSIEKIPEQSRVLVTSHDAFGYLGRRYGMDVVAIQGVSTASEATTADIKRVAGIIVDRDVKAVFIESSVPRQTIESVLAEAAEQGHDAEIGGELYADAAGEEGTPEGTYTGMLRANIDKIVTGLS